MKYKVDFKSMLIGHSILILISGVCFFFPNFDITTGAISPLYFIMMICLILGMVIYLILDRILRHFRLEKNCFVNKKMLSKEEILYSDIMYIDEEKFNKGLLVFYLFNKRRYSFVLDAKKELGYELIKKCKHLISKEEFDIKYSHLDK